MGRDSGRWGINFTYLGIPIHWGTRPCCLDGFDGYNGTRWLAMLFFLVAATDILCGGGGCTHSLAM